MWVSLESYQEEVQDFGLLFVFLFEKSFLVGWLWRLLVQWGGFGVVCLEFVFFFFGMLRLFLWNGFLVGGGGWERVFDIYVSDVGILIMNMFVLGDESVYICGFGVGNDSRREENY